MNRKDIALTVGGVVAGLTLTYLLYRLQKRDAALAAANADASQDASYQQQQNEASYSAQLPQISFQMPSTSEGSVDPTSSDGTDIGAATEGLFSDILAAFGSSITSQPGSSLIIPTETAVNNSLSQIPTTVQGAQAGVASNILPVGTIPVYVSPNQPTGTTPTHNIITPGGSSSNGYNIPLETLQGPGSQ